MQAAATKLRIDKYLWAIRIFKTRALASKACDDGKVRCNGDAIKASKQVSVGDEYTIKTSDKKWVIEVLQLIEQRVQYAEAIKQYTDKSPIIDTLTNTTASIAFAFNTGKRQSKQARPTKKQRRNLDGFMDS
ncbi:MAG: hypothetical protein RL708_265 [Bacteroidota bacterium]|jgi:ribosome-associated heat shock protein Hsp15